MTGWQALHDHAGLRPDDEVLVHGGAGGVGGFAVQLAAQADAMVTATVRGADRRATARQLGAGRVIDVSQHGLRRRAGPIRHRRWTRSAETTLDRSYSLAAPGWTVGDLAAPPSAERAAQYQATALFFIVPHRTGTSSGVGRDWSTAARLQVTIAATFPFADGQAAFESGQTWHRPPGKTVLVVRE